MNCLKIIIKQKNKKKTIWLVKEGLHASTTFIPGYKYNVVTKQHNKKIIEK